MSSSSPRSDRGRRPLSIGIALAGLGLVLLALLQDLLGHRSPDFGLVQSLVALLGIAVALEGALELTTPRRPALWATMTEPGWRGTAVAALLAAGLMDTLLYAFRRYFVDDAYITFRFARNLASGLGLVWNLGEHPVEGYSNFLWLLLSAGALRAHFDPLAAARAVAVACYFGSAVALHGLVRGLTPSPLAPRVAVLLFAAIPAFALWTVSGLETSSVVLLSLLFFTVSTREIASGLPWRTALCAVLLVLSRPETPLLILLSLVPMLGAARLDADPLPGPGARRRWLVSFGALVLPVVVIYSAWKWRIFGTPVPNAFSNRARPLAGAALTTDFFAFFFPLFLAWLVGRARRASTLTERRILWAAGGFLLAALNFASPAGHVHRYFLPVLAPLLALPALASEALASEPRGVRRRIPWGAIALGLTLVYCLVPSFAMKSDAEREVEGYRGAHQRVAALLERRYPPSAVLAASDCGLIPYLSQMKTIDILGLTDRRPRPRGSAAAYVMDRRPEAVILHSLHPDRFAGRESQAGELYEALADDPAYVTAGQWEFPGYWLWLLVRVEPSRRSHIPQPRPRARVAPAVRAAPPAVGAPPATEPLPASPAPQDSAAPPPDEPPPDQR